MKPLFTIILCFTTLILLSQNEVNNLRNISTEVVRYQRGLSQNSVRSIYQDRHGFMWFGTWDGLNRFDGINFITISETEDEKYNLNSYSINNITQFEDDNLWLSTERGISKLNTITHNTQNNIGGINDTIYHLHKDETGVLWISGHNGLKLFDIKNNRTLSLSGFENSDLVLDKEVRYVLQQNENIFWISNEHGLLKLNRKQKKIINYNYVFADTLEENGVSITSLEIYKDSMLLLASESGFHTLNLKSDIVKSFSENDGSGLKNNFILSVYVDSDNKIWVGSSGYGLFIYDPILEKFNRAEPSSFELEKPKKSFSNEYINTVFQSKDGLIWCGTAYNGAYYFATDVQLFQHFKTHKAGVSGLSNNNIWNFEFVNNEIWIASNGGISIYNPTNHSFNYLNTSNGLKSNLVRYLYHSTDNEIWIATNDMGLQRYDIDTEKFIAHYNIKNADYPLSGSNVWHIIEDKDGFIWVSTLNGISRINPKNNEVKIYRNSTEKGSLSNNNVYSIHIDNNDEFWIATLGGLNHYIPSEDRFENFKHIEGDSSSLSTNKLFSVSSDTLGNLWIGTWGGGLNRFNKTTKKVKFFNQSHGLSNNVVYNIIDTKDGNLWMSTNDGINKLNIFTEQITQYNIEDGVQSAEFNLNAAALSKSGEVYFGGPNGFNVFNPQIIDDKDFSYQLSFSDLKINNIEKYYYLYSNDTLNLKYNENNIYVEFSALNFNKPFKIKYRYRINNYSNRWKLRDADQAYVDLSNLSPGNYIIQVKSTNSKGQWNDYTSNLYIVINKAWYQTSLFKIILISIVILLFWYVISSRIKRIKRKHEIDRRLYELEKQSLKLQMNPHFIFNTLNAIQSFIYDSNRKESVKYLSKFSKLMRMMLNSANLETIVLSEEIKMLSYYIELERLRFDNKFDLKIEIDDELDIEFIEIPPMLIQPYIENSIIHGLVPLENRGELLLKFENHNDYVNIIIKDNGVGRDYHRNKKNRTKHKSKGMLITRERLMLINKDFNDDFSIKINDLKDSENNASGTEVVLKIKI